MVAVGRSGDEPASRSDTDRLEACPTLGRARHAKMSNLQSANSHVRAVVGQHYAKHADKAVRAPPAKFLNSPALRPIAPFAICVSADFRQAAPGEISCAA